MLETEIKKLTDAVIALTEVISKGQVVAPVIEEQKVIVEQIKEVVTETEKQPEPQQETLIDDAPSIEDLQSKCLDLVRKDPKNKKAVKQLINEFGGEIIADIDASKLSEFAAKLGEI